MTFVSLTAQKKKSQITFQVPPTIFYPFSVKSNTYESLIKQISQVARKFKLRTYLPLDSILGDGMVCLKRQQSVILFHLLRQITMSGQGYSMTYPTFKIYFVTGLNNTKTHLL